jgi:ribulose 1,5-bisphosphate synthetase/thiazole synthase
MPSILVVVILIIIIFKVIKDKQSQVIVSQDSKVIEEPKIELTYLDKVALNYQPKNYFFTQSELIFFKILEEENNERFLILSKVRFEDLISRKDKTISGRGYVKSKHVDFVIICKNTGKIHTLIELDGNSHNGYKQQNLDDVKNKIANSAYKDRFHRIKVGSDFRVQIRDIFSTISC